MYERQQANKNMVIVWQISLTGFVDNIKTVGGGLGNDSLVLFPETEVLKGWT